MLNGIRSIKVKLSLCVAALGALMAIGGVATATAQAATWSYGQSGYDGPVSFAGTILGAPTEPSCNGVAVNGSISGGEGTTVISFSECEDKVAPTCAVAPFTLEAVLTTVTVEGVTYEKLTPPPGAPNQFGVIRYSGGECPFNEVEAAFKGAMAGVRETGGSLHFSEAAAKAIGVQPKLGKASIVVNGRIDEPTSTALAEPETSALSGGPFELSWTYAGLPITVSCEGVSVTTNYLLPKGEEEIEGLRLTGCGTNVTNCEIQGGALQFPPMVGELVTAEGKYYDRFSTASGGPLFEHLYFSGGNCGLTEADFRVSGSFAGRVTGPDWFLPYLPIELSGASTLAAGGGLKVGYYGNPGTLTGTLSQSLTGALAGYGLGALAGYGLGVS